MSSQNEKESFALLLDTRKALEEMLHGAEKTQPDLRYDRKYIYLLAGFVFRAVDGYVLLRQNGRVDASKLLIRPAMEAMFRGGSALNQPEIFFRIAYTELESDLMWLRRAKSHDDDQSVSLDLSPREKSWQRFEGDFKAQFPKLTPKKSPFGLEASANNASMSGYYDTYYRLYCRYQHVALAAIGQMLDQITDAEDNRAMALCTFSMADYLVHVGLPTPDGFDELKKRLEPPLG